MALNKSINDIGLIHLVYIFMKFYLNGYFPCLIFVLFSVLIFRIFRSVFSLFFQQLQMNYTSVIVLHALLK